MKILITLLGIIFLACTAHAEENTALKTKKEKISYGIGMDVGKSLKQQELDVDPEIVSRGINDILSGNKPLMTEEEFRSFMTELKKDMMAKQMEQRAEAGIRNKEESETFLAENGEKDGVVTLPSGLQYKVIEEGTGATPKLTDTVTVHYRGTLIDGTEFDSSHGRGQPATFPVNGVIPGWTEALQLMKTGAKWKLFIPSDLAYGERGAGRSIIGPNAALIFDVELLSIKENAGK